jgi:hypothetical protein
MSPAESRSILKLYVRVSDHGLHRTELTLTVLIQRTCYLTNMPSVNSKYGFATSIALDFTSTAYFDISIVLARLRPGTLAEPAESSSHLRNCRLLRSADCTGYEIWARSLFILGRPLTSKLHSSFLKTPLITCTDGENQSDSSGCWHRWSRSCDLLKDQRL